MCHVDSIMTESGEKEGGGNTYNNVKKFRTSLFFLNMIMKCPRCWEDYDSRWVLRIIIITGQGGKRNSCWYYWSRAVIIDVMQKGQGSWTEICVDVLERRKNICQ